MGIRDSKRIVAAAIMYQGKVYSLPAPARHHDVIRHIAEATGETSIGENEQGFLDDLGQFLRRRPAMLVAQRAGQLLSNRAPVLRELYSENVW